MTTQMLADVIYLSRVSEKLSQNVQQNPLFLGGTERVQQTRTAPREGVRNDHCVRPLHTKQRNGA
jgi:hypothetical protein